MVEGKEKFELEVNGAKHEFSFTKPTLKHRREFLKWSAENQKVIEDVKAGKVPANTFDMIEQTIRLKNKLILELMEENTHIKKVEDFDNVACDDLERLWNWFDGMIGFRNTKEEAHFLPPSGK